MFDSNLIKTTSFTKPDGVPLISRVISVHLYMLGSSVGSGSTSGWHWCDVEVGEAGMAAWSG
jgi:hypothetical protein